MTYSFSQFELPPAFLRRFRPIRVTGDRAGIAAYLFDSYRLEFFQRMATAEPVAAEAIWTVGFDGDNSPCLLAGRRPDAAGYIVTQIPRPTGMEFSFPLIKRLSYRQKIQIAAIKKLRNQLRAATIDVPAELSAFIDQRIGEIAQP